MEAAAPVLHIVESTLATCSAPPSDSDSATVTVLLDQLRDLKHLLTLQNRLLQDQCVEISALQARIRAAERGNGLKDEKIARLERHQGAAKGIDVKGNTAGLRPERHSTRHERLLGSKSQTSTRATSRASSRAPDSHVDPALSYRETDKVYGFVEVRALDKDEVLVPAWREPSSPISRNPRALSGQPADQAEDVSDAVYERRHRKFEVMEKRRKRADREQALIAMQQEEYAGYLATGLRAPSPPPAPKAFSFYPDPMTNLKVVEVTTALPLVAWGQPVPDMTPESFTLPRTGSYSFEPELDFASYHRRGKGLTPIPTPTKGSRNSTRTRKRFIQPP